MDTFYLVAVIFIIVTVTTNGCNCAPFNCTTNYLTVACDVGGETSQISLTCKPRKDECTADACPKCPLASPDQRRQPTRCGNLPPSCTITKEELQEYIPCPKWNTSDNDDVVRYYCQKAPPNSDPLSNPDRKNDDPEVEDTLTIALVACGVIILVLAVMVGVLFLRRRRLHKAGVNGTKNDAIREDDPLSRAGSRYSKLDEGGLQRHESTYNHIPYDTESYTEIDGIDLPSVLDGSKNDKPTTKEPVVVADQTYTTLEKLDAAPDLPARPQDPNTDYNVLNERLEARNGKNVYDHASYDYDKVNRHPHPPKTGSDYSHLEHKDISPPNADVDDDQKSDLIDDAQSVASSVVLDKGSEIEVADEGVELPVETTNIDEGVTLSVEQTNVDQDVELPVTATDVNEGVERPLETTYRDEDVELPVTTTNVDEDVERPLEITNVDEAVELSVATTNMDEDVKLSVETTNVDESFEESDNQVESTDGAKPPSPDDYKYGTNDIIEGQSEGAEPTSEGDGVEPSLEVPKDTTESATEDDYDDTGVKTTGANDVPLPTATANSDVGDSSSDEDSVNREVSKKKEIKQVDSYEIPTPLSTD